MSETAFEKPVEDSVPQINEEVAVGEDLEFQRRWWRFERGVWTLFALIILATCLGAYGRGPLSKGHLHNESMSVEYERIARTGTPSMMRITLAPEASSEGKTHLYVSESVVRTLGAQRIIPAPESSTVGNGGITYTFPVEAGPAVIAFALQPDGPAVTHFTLQVPGQAALNARVITVP